MPGLFVLIPVPVYRVKLGAAASNALNALNAPNAPNAP